MISIDSLNIECVDLIFINDNQDINSIIYGAKTYIKNDKPIIIIKNLNSNSINFFLQQYNYNKIYIDQYTLFIS